MRSIPFAVLVVFFAFGPAGLRAAEDPPVAGKPAEKAAGKAEKAEAKAGGKAKGAVSLFDGKTLKGWKVLGCEAVVEDGAIFMKGGNGVVRTERKYKDYTFEVEWKALKQDKWDSGIYIRCDDPPKGEAWPKVYQVNLLKGMEGNIAELPAARSSGLVKPGEWNRFKLTVVGTKAELEINGKPAWKADGLKNPEGYISLQAEVPGGGQFLFRDVKITEL
jgi:hypothetical protein